MAEHNDTDGHKCEYKELFVTQSEHHEKLLRALERARSEGLWLQRQLKPSTSAGPLDEDEKYLTHIDLAMVRESLSEVVGCINECYNEREAIWRPTASSAIKAKQVLDIPELVDNIFEFLPFPDLRKAALANKAMAASFQQWLKRQKSLQMQSMANAWSTPFPPLAWGSIVKKTTLGFECSDGYIVPSDWDRNTPNPTSACPPTNFIRVTASFSALPKIGTACRDMPISNPAPKIMQVSLSCCSNYHQQEFWVNQPAYGSTGLQPLSHSLSDLEAKTEIGITVGELHDATLRYKAEHSLCPFASPWRLEKDGTMNPDVTFSGDVYLSNDSPTIKQNRAFWLENRQRDDRLSLEQAEAAGFRHLQPPALDMQAYTDVKRTAFRCGMEIPSPSQYQTKKEWYDAKVRYVDVFGAWGEGALDDVGWNRSQNTLRSSSDSDVSGRSERGEDEGAGVESADKSVDGEAAAGGEAEEESPAVSATATD